MWLNANEYSKLIERLNDLESEVLRLKHNTTYQVQDYIAGIGTVGPCVELRHNDLFRKILDHLGLKLKVSPARVASADLISNDNKQVMT